MGAICYGAGLGQLGDLVDAAGFRRGDHRCAASERFERDVRQALPARGSSSASAPATQGAGLGSKPAKLTRSAKPSGAIALRARRVLRLRRTRQRAGAVASLQRVEQTIIALLAR